eukprot:CAMPEP_0119571090 /NCGR_PEP_ID=MMETSP1352-20130426/43944_1 /TAXON_ID=265584 /ORGANISM="Stauroneis constricta, Strain CCMP1120" /LENGTH=340 /DNA_ID=CAMNT_0007620769 /DNA_START=2080 /DNA_END=3104 /DNA_ORIENTATION=+
MPAERQIFMQASDDWTKKVHRVLQRDTVRPAWVQGPFPSPYDSAEEYDANQILVASGIGITPGPVRHPRAEAFPSHQSDLDGAGEGPVYVLSAAPSAAGPQQGWNLIFYTGREDLPDDIIEVYSNTNVNIIRGRPKLSEVIPNIIYSIESGKGLPERYKPDEEIGITEQLVDMLDNTNKSECLNDDNDEYDAENRYNENDDDDDASITTQQLNDVKKETAKNLGFELDGIEKSGLSADPNIRCPKEHRNRRSTAIMENLNLGFTPWDEHPESIPFVKTLSRKFVLKTWGLLYCGGARVVEKDLRKLSHELKIDLMWNPLVGDDGGEGDDDGCFQMEVLAH